MPTVPIAVRLGRRIKALRKKAKLTQAQFAEKLGTGSTYIVRIEKGTVHIGSDLLEKIADVLDVEISLLFEIGEKIPTENLLPELQKTIAKANEKQLRLILKLAHSIVY